MTAVTSPVAKTRVKASPPPAAAAALSPAQATALAEVTHKLTGSLGSMIDAMWAVREEKRKLEDQLKIVQKKMDDYEIQLDTKMASDGLDKATGSKASASFSSTVSASVQGDEGWAELYKYIAKNKFWHLLQRRVSDPAYRELLEAGKKVPGVQPFNKKRLTLRSLSS